MKFPNTVRALAVAMPAASLLVWSCGVRSSGRLPSELKRFPEDLSHEGLDVAGIYPDGWVAPTASVSLGQPGRRQALVVRGVVPKISDAAFRTDIELRVDDRPVARQSVGVGDFRLAAPVQDGATKRRVQMIFSASQQLPGGDDRAVGARLQFLGFEPAQMAERGAARDIVHGSGLQLGSGWGALETFRNETFRWVENDAQILITASQPGDATVVALVEPGPGVGGGAFLLKALDAAGRQVNAVKVTGRRSVELFLPVVPGKPNEFRLHVDGGGERTPQDPRILNFRVLRIEVAPTA
jgi:hypothetical protein